MPDFAGGSRGEQGVLSNKKVSTTAKEVLRQRLLRDLYGPFVPVIGVRVGFVEYLGN